MDEILMLQDEISELQSSLAEELVSESPESDPAEQLALQSTLTVLAERMSTIKMKASGKRQLLEVTSHSAGSPHIQINSSTCVDKHASHLRDLHFYGFPLRRSWYCVCLKEGLMNRALSQCVAFNVSFHYFLTHFSMKN